MKIFLNELTPEQVIKELKEGKVATSKTGESLKMIDGVLIETTEGSYFLNSCVYIGDDKTMSSEFYFTYEDPFKVEVGKFYKNRQGQKAFVYAVNPDRPEEFLCVCLGEGYSIGVYANGRTDQHNKSDYDLVEEWKE